MTLEGVEVIYGDGTIELIDPVLCIEIFNGFHRYEVRLSAGEQVVLKGLPVPEGEEQ